MVISVHVGKAAICSGVSCGMNRGLACTGFGAAGAGADCACADAGVDIASGAMAAIAMSTARIDSW
jgi:hypothetical protein